MIRRIVTTIALCTLGALNAQAQPATPPGHAGHDHPGHGSGKPEGAGKPKDNKSSKEDKAAAKEEKKADKDKGEGADGAKAEERKAERVAKLKERAAQLRKDGKEKQAELLEKQAERVASGEIGGEKSQANREKVRSARKLARIKLLQRRYGESLSTNEVRQEVEHHARRSAHLSRMKELVSGRPDGDDKQKAAKTKMMERINRLMARENARHSRHMAKLTKQNDKLAGKPGDAVSAPGAAEKKEEGQK